MSEESSDRHQIDIGQRIYDVDGEELGSVRGFDENGFYVSTREGIQGLSIAHQRAGHEFGEAELMWRCASCGETRSIGELPDECPSCGGEKEGIYYWIED